MTTVYSAKTNEALHGIASAKLVEACAANPEGKALASHDAKQEFASGGVWYPVEESWGHKGAVIVFVEESAPWAYGDDLPSTYTDG